MKRKKVLFKVFLFIILFLILNIISYFKYDNNFDIYNEVLIEENQFLKKELREIGKFNLDYDSYFIGKVLYRDMYSFYDEIAINNLNNKLIVGDAVVNEYGLIGIIYKTYNNISYAKLLTSNYNVSVVIGDVYGNLNNGVVTMLNKYSDIKVGDLVYTSGFGEVEKGLFVGIVKKVCEDKDGLGKEVLVELVNNDYLNYVGIVRKLK